MRAIDLIQHQLESAKNKGLILDYSTMFDLQNESTMSITVFFALDMGYKSKEQLREFLQKNHQSVAVFISNDESYMTIISTADAE